MKDADDVASHLRGSELQHASPPSRPAAATITPDEIEAMATCLAASEKVVQRRAAEAVAQLQREPADIRLMLLATRSTTSVNVGEPPTLFH
jgi:hypothetical protein